MTPEMVTPEHDIRKLGAEVYERIEKPNWAPWLRVDQARLVDRMMVFPDGHMTLKNEEDIPVGFLSTNRISWDGNPDTLSTWDGVAGENGNFQDTCVPDGNTICLMSMGAAAGFKGQRVAEEMVTGIQKIAREKGVEHIIGDFRPSGFGQYKHMTGNYNFTDYVSQKRFDGRPLDPWLRNVSYLGMEPLKVDNRAMVVPASLDELLVYMTEYKPDAWYEVEDPAGQKTLIEQQQPELNLRKITNIFECEETGTWYVDVENREAVYIESNYWGEIPV
jgi:hypothetical protein